MPYSKKALAKIAEGFCYSCDDLRGEDGTNIYCRPCADEMSAVNRERRRRYRRAGKCQCGRDIDTHSRHCDRCVDEFERLGERGRANAERWLRAGLCFRCGDGQIGLSTECWKHTMMRFASSHFTGKNQRSRWRELEDLWNGQGGRCYYTGAMLELGVNASIDHRIPTSRGGGEADIVWCLYGVNVCKNKLSEDEFRLLCKAVTEGATEQEGELLSSFGLSMFRTGERAGVSWSKRTKKDAVGQIAA